MRRRSSLRGTRTRSRSRRVRKRRNRGAQRNTEKTDTAENSRDERRGSWKSVKEYGERRRREKDRREK